MARFCLLIFSLTASVYLGEAQNTNHNTPRRDDFRFEVLSIKAMGSDGDIYSGSTGNTTPTPNGFVTRLSIFQLIMLAYAPGDFTTWGTVQVRNLPGWNGTFYDIKGRVADADLSAWQHQSAQHELLRAAVRTALKERCKLAIHEEPSKGEALELLVSKRGPQLQAAAQGYASRVGAQLQSGGVMEQEVVKGSQVKHFYGATMEDLARFLTGLSRGTPVRDQTHLSARYDFTVREQPGSPGSTPREPSYFLDKYPISHLGLELKRGVESRPSLVIDRIEQPTAN